MRWLEVIEDVDLMETSKLTKLKQAIYGLRGSDGIAILTPQNPNGGEASAKAKSDMTQAEINAKNADNNARMDQAKKFLKFKGYHYFVQKGVFEGETEESFVIFNISFDDAYKLGRHWQQTSIIYIQPNKNPNYREFVYIPTNGDNVRDPRDLVLSLVRKVHDLPAEASDCMSIIGGNKYLIPFFNDREEYYAQHGTYDSGHIRKAGPSKGTPIYKTKAGNTLPPKSPSPSMGLSLN